jgi:hypothetical protein
MAFQPEHSGLYFGQVELEQARNLRDSDANLQMAWQWLRAKSGDVIREIKPDKRGGEATIIRKPALSPLEEAVANGMCYRFMHDTQAGTQAAAYLKSALQDKSTLLETVMATVAAAHIYEMVRPLAGDSWLKQFSVYVDSLVAAHEPTYLERIWLMTLSVVAGIVLDDEPRFQQGIDQFRHIIDNDIHPEGYIKPLISADQTATFRDFTLAAAALTLAAEAATQAGVNLWAYEKREVGVNTVATYLVYYFFYPEKWHWQEQFTEADTQAIFKQYGAFIEMVTYRGYPRGVEMLLEQERPLFSSLGGLTTLSHIKAQKPKRRWFGF